MLQRFVAVRGGRVGIYSEMVQTCGIHPEWQTCRILQVGWKGVSMRLIGVTKCNRRMGEDHPNAKLTNHEVDLVFELRELGMSYQAIASRMEVSKSQIRNILTGKRRAKLPARFRALIPKNP
jgi:predicted DNA-binding protein (UPF0251 family)